jgi:hypothetical protein
MKIGELAAQAGLAPSAVEKREANAMGTLPPPLCGKLPAPSFPNRGLSTLACKPCFRVNPLQTALTEETGINEPTDL